MEVWKRIPRRCPLNPTHKYFFCLCRCTMYLKFILYSSQWSSDRKESCYWVFAQFWTSPDEVVNSFKFGFNLHFFYFYCCFTVTNAMPFKIVIWKITFCLSVCIISISNKLLHIKETRLSQTCITTNNRQTVTSIQKRIYSQMLKTCCRKGAFDVQVDIIYNFCGQCRNTCHIQQFYIKFEVQKEGQTA